MPKPTLSPSKLSTFLACPLEYRWTYLDPRGKWYFKVRSCYSFGLTLHKVLQRFHDSADAGVKTVHEAVAAVEESWIEAGYSSQDEMNQAMAEGKAMIRAHLEDERFVRTDGAKTIYVEKRLEADLGAFRLVGRIDRIDELPDGTLEIVDYKSRREDVCDEDVATDLAMCCYQLLVGEAFPGRRVQARLICLATGAEGKASMQPDELAELRADLGLLGAEILARDWEYVLPTPKPMCVNCDFLPLCRKSQEFEEDFLRAFPAATVRLVSRAQAPR